MLKFQYKYRDASVVSAEPQLYTNGWFQLKRLSGEELDESLDRTPWNLRGFDINC